jgi:hypothetical protein
MQKLFIAMVLSALATVGATSAARSQYQPIGDPPTSYWTYGDVPLDPDCTRWNWQERSWYDLCTRLHHPLAWGYRGRERFEGPIIRARD